MDGIQSWDELYSSIYNELSKGVSKSVVRSNGPRPFRLEYLDQAAADVYEDYFGVWPDISSPDGVSTWLPV